MTLFYADPLATLHQGHVLDILAQLPAESVNCVVTSPPYWGLRKYAGNQERLWDNHNGCEHEWHDGSVSGEIYDTKTGGTGCAKRTSGNVQAVTHTHSTCLKCGAWRGAYGLEPTIALYVQHTVTILQAIRRVLRKDGVVWWNVGDSYGGSMSGGIEDNKAAQHGTMATTLRSARPSANLKPKDLCLIPSRVALAAQDDGWWVRSMIVWSKPNPMPESVTDRPTDAYENIIMLTKSKTYWYDNEAVKEDSTEPAHKCGRNSNANTASTKQGRHENRTIAGFNERYDFENPSPTRNLRNVWEITTTPFKGSHFAVFPEKIPERCILASCPEKVCAECGRPYEPVVEETYQTQHDGSTMAKGEDNSNYKRLALVRQHLREHGMENKPSPIVTGYAKACQCSTNATVSGTVLEPFAGSGTTLAVAKRLGRKSIGIELSEQYCQLAVKRIQAVTLPLVAANLDKGVEG